MIPDLHLLDSWKRGEMKYEHHFDCYFWSYHICTCGLLHCLQPRIVTDEWPKELYPKFYEQIGLQSWVLQSEEFRNLATEMKRKMEEHIHKLQHDPVYIEKHKEMEEELKRIFGRKQT